VKSLGRTRRAVEVLHLVYLGLLPALATFSILVVYGHPAPALLFVGGIIAVSVYLAVVIGYTRPTNSLGVALFTLLDGPLWAVLSRSVKRASMSPAVNVFSFAIDAFLIDGVAIWIAIVWLAVSTSRPTREQRIATVGFALVAVGSTLFAFWPYVRENAWGEWTRSFWLVTGVVEAVVARHYLLEADKVMRKEMVSMVYILILLFVWIVALCAGNIINERGRSVSATVTPVNTPTPPKRAPTNTPRPTATPFSLLTPRSRISQASLFAFLEELTTIQPYSGWRNSATEGEAEALDYVATTLGGFAYLQGLGMELERQSFHVFLATELWETQLYVTTQGREARVPADAPRGHRHDVVQALRFDSDGALNDADRNPVVVEGEVVLIRSTGEIDGLEEIELRDKILFLDYALLDPTIETSGPDARIVTRLWEKDMAGLVLVTQISAEAGRSHGKFVGDGIALERINTGMAPPTLYVRLEDLASAGVASWEDLGQIEAARLVWDTDVFSPGTSGNLVARIPGADSSRAIILGAHIDSPNSPGAIDNGINSAVMLEVARILNEGQIQPAIDVYLTWFGSEELWLYGSQHFVNTHQELLDRTVAAFLMDGITVATPGPILVLDGWSHSRFGNAQLAFPHYLAQMAAARNIPIDEVEDYQAVTSDNAVFSGFVPQAGFAFGSENNQYAHSPYDTIDVVRGMGDLIEQVTAMALGAALETGRDLPELRATPRPDRRALFVASHTEVAHMTPTTLVDLDRALAWEGFDVDVIPYGQTVTPADLADSDLVIALPVIDYPSPGGDLAVYDEMWNDEEIKALVTYVAQGGLLVSTNSANRILFGQAFDANEDWQDVNALSEHFGVLFEPGALSSSSAQIQREHPLMEGQSRLTMITNNGVPFTMQTGEVLAEAEGEPAIGLVDYGDAGGQVLVLADVGMLGFAGLVPPERDNLPFLRNLARYARDR
jgi:hypothetical protein